LVVLKERRGVGMVVVCCNKHDDDDDDRQRHVVPTSLGRSKTMKKLETHVVHPGSPHVKGREVAILKVELTIGGHSSSPSSRPSRHQV
jgi:hypothetical protein